MEEDNSTIEVTVGDFCDPEKPNDMCHFEYLEVNGQDIYQMTAANTYFIISAWVNFLAPFGYWALWVFLKLDPVTNIMPLFTDAMALLTSVTALVATLGSADADGNGVENELTDAEAIETATTSFMNELDAFIAKTDTLTAILSWPIVAGCGIASVL